MSPWNNETLGSCAFVDPYAASSRDSVWPGAEGPFEDIDSHLPPPDPARRLGYIIDPHDQRRLALHATLTAAGIPPMPEDRAVIDQISALPADVNDVLQRWLHHAL
ncbi:hypothetical protein OHB54_04515 [Streptomyces sp. NBC_01007]|nr:hypothetical protein OHB54_04515 [Streptomyces sp. NBC_01007]